MRENTTLRPNPGSRKLGKSLFCSLGKREGEGEESKLGFVARVSTSMFNYKRRAELKSV